MLPLVDTDCLLEVFEPVASLFFFVLFVFIDLVLSVSFVACEDVADVRGNNGHGALKVGTESDSPCRYWAGGRIVSSPSFGVSTTIFPDANLKLSFVCKALRAALASRDVTPPSLLDQSHHIDRFTASGVKKRYKCFAMNSFSVLENCLPSGNNFRPNWNRRKGIRPATIARACVSSDGCTKKVQGALALFLSAQ